MGPRRHLCLPEEVLLAVATSMNGLDRQTMQETILSFPDHFPWLLLRLGRPPILKIRLLLLDSSSFSPASQKRRASQGLVVVQVTLPPTEINKRL